MAQRILVLDSDGAYAEALRAAFEQDGDVVETLWDGNQGVDRALDFRPDGVVLAVELEGTNGFLVCKRFRKTPELADVPIVILSSDEAAEEIFEQHRRLRTHADAYLRKPIPPEDVLGALRPMVLERANGTAASVEPPGDGGDSSAAEAIDLEDIEVEEPGSKPPVEGVDDEIEAFAENAFGSLIVSEQEAPAAAATPPPAPGEEEVPGPFGAPHRISDAQELATFRARTEQLEAELETFRRRAADADRLQDEVAALRAQIERGGGASTRELLDLREALNGKDKELLDARDQLGRRDKELLEARNESLQLGRTLADHEDKALAFERRLASADDRVRALEGQVAELEREGAERRQELDAARGRVASLEGELEEARAEHRREAERLAQEHGAEIARLREAHEAALASKDEAHARRVTELEQHEADALAAAENARETGLGELRRDLDARRERELEELREEHESELGVLGRKLSETETELRGTQEQLSDEQRTRAGVESELGSVRQLRDGLQASLDETRRHLGQVEAERNRLRRDVAALQDKIGGDAAILERARRALAIGLGLLDDQRANEVSSAGSLSAPPSAPPADGEG